MRLRPEPQRLNRPHQGNALGIHLESTIRFTDSDHSARQLLQLLLLEMGLSADLDELDRRVAADPAFPPMPTTPRR